MLSRRYHVDVEAYNRGNVYWKKRWGGPTGQGQPGHVQLTELLDSDIYYIEERRPGFVPAYGASVLGPHRAVEVVSPQDADPMYGLPLWDGLDAEVIHIQTSSPAHH